MRCIADEHYEVILNRRGEIRYLKCAFCIFVISKMRTPKPRSSKSGLGRYNRMRGQMVAHLHDHHRDELEKDGRQ